MGTTPGKAVAMVFVQFPDDSNADTPIIQLRGFEKTDTLSAGGTETVVSEITRKDVSVWDVVVQNWIVPSVKSRYLFWIGVQGAVNLTLACDSLAGVCSAGRKSPV